MFFPLSLERLSCGRRNKTLFCLVPHKLGQMDGLSREADFCLRKRKYLLLIRSVQSEMAFSEVLWKGFLHWMEDLLGYPIVLAYVLFYLL